MKISVGMLVVNGRPFIEAQLKNLYKTAHEIVICEGGDDFWEKRHGYRRSTDGTIEIIKNFPDPQEKIKLIQKDWRNKNEMSHTFSKNMTGDIIYSVDLDEFMHPEQLVKACQTLMKSSYNSVLIPHLIFFGDFNTLLAMDHSDTWMHVPRIFKRSKTHLIHHLPMGYWSPESEKMVGAANMPYSHVKGVFIHHYSWIYKKAVRDKIKYYAFRIKNCIKPGFMEKFEGFEENREQLIKDKTNIRPTLGPKQFLKEFKGKHIPAVKLVQDDLAKLGND